MVLILSYCRNSCGVSAIPLGNVTIPTWWCKPGRSPRLSWVHLGCMCKESLQAAGWCWSYNRACLSLWLRAEKMSCQGYEALCSCKGHLLEGTKYQAQVPLLRSLVLSQESGCWLCFLVTFLFEELHSSSLEFLLQFLLVTGVPSEIQTKTFPLFSFTLSGLLHCSASCMACTACEMLGILQSEGP